MLPEIETEDVQDKLNAKLIRMGNHIATFFSSQKQSNAMMGVAEHINKFWDPRMRRQLFRISAGSREEFHPLLQEALSYINKPEDP